MIIHSHRILKLSATLIRYQNLENVTDVALCSRQSDFTEWLFVFGPHPFQSKSSLDQMESQSADAEAPPPPKPELRYPGLPRADTEGEMHIQMHN